MYDVASLQRTLNGIYGSVVDGRLVPKVVTMQTARRLMVLGQKAIAEAKRISPLGDDTARDRTWWKLDWHRVQLDSAGMQILSTPYPHADDLRVWVVQAFVEVNAAIDAAAYADSITVWGELGRQLDEIAGTVAGAVGGVLKPALGGAVVLAVALVVLLLVVRR